MNRTALITTMMAASLGACGPDEGAGTSPITAATLGEQAVLPADHYLAQEPYATADIRRGETLSMQCRACHTVDKDGGHLVGPNLYGVFGRPAGSAPDYEYSSVLAASSIVWTPRALDAWLAQPYAFLPGNRMSFPGLVDGQDRSAVIAYLLRQTTGLSNDGT
jgi:cytochrome c